MGDFVGVKFLYGDYADPIFGAIVNNSPAYNLDMVPANALNRSRDLMWRTANSPADPLDLEIDLGASKSVGAVGLCNFYASDLSTLGVVTDVYGSTDGVNWGSSLVTIPSITWTLGAKDAMKALTAGATSKRYWRFRFTSTEAFLLGKVMLGKYWDSAGDGPMPGATYTIHKRRDVTETMDGRMITSRSGPTTRRIILPWGGKDDTTKGLLMALAENNGPFMMTDELGNSLHVESDGDDVDFRSVWGSPNVWETELRFRQLL